MRLESLQILASVAHRYGFEPPRNDRGDHYGAGYVNHPCSVWAGDSRSNYLWVCDYVQALILEADYRGYAPKYQEKLDHCYAQSHFVPAGNLTDMPLAMARQSAFRPQLSMPVFYYRCCLVDGLVSQSEYDLAVATRHAPIDIAVKFYRGYLMYGKCHYAAWRHTEIPSFWPTTDNAGKLFCRVKILK